MNWDNSGPSAPENAPHNPSAIGMAPAPETNMGPARPKRNRRNLIIGGVAGLLVLAGIGNAIGGEEVRGRQT